MSGMTTSNERGSALVITLMLLLVLTAIGIYAISISTTEMDIALRSKVGTSTLNAAEAGTYYGIDRVPIVVTDCTANLLNGTSYVVSTVATPNFTLVPGYGANFGFEDFQVASTGRAQSVFSATKRIEAVVSYGPMPMGTMY